MAQRQKGAQFVTLGCVLSIGVLAACGGPAQEDTEGPRPGPSRQFDPNEEGVFGPGGASLTNALSGDFLGRGTAVHHVDADKADGLGG